MVIKNRPAESDTLSMHSQNDNAANLDSYDEDPSQDSFYKLCERSKPTAQMVTKKNEEKSISDGTYISPPGCIGVLKNVTINGDQISFDLVTLGGVKMEDIRTWTNSNKIFIRNINLDKNRFDCKNLKVVNSFQVTKTTAKTASGSAIPELITPSYVDLEPQESNLIHLIVYGGQKVDMYETNDDIIIIKGPADLSKDIDVTLYPEI